MKLKNTFILKIIFLIFAAASVCAQISFAQEKVIEAQTLSPSVHFDAQSFLDAYRQTYGNTDIDLEHAAVSAEDVQKQRQDFLIKSIRGNLEKNPEYSGTDKGLFETVLKLAESEYADKKFPSPSNEFFLHHTLEAAYSLSEWGAPVEAIAAALLHRLDERNIVEILKNKLNKTDFDEITTLLHNFLFVTDFYYASMPLDGAVHDIQNFMNAIIQLAAKDRGTDMDRFEPDYRVMLLVFADKLATISFASEIDREDLIKEIEEMYAPLADRLGYEEIKKQLLNESFKLSRNAEYNQIRKMVKDYFGREYEDLKDYLIEVEEMLKEKAAEQYGMDRAQTLKISTRLKGLYEIAEKLKDLESIDYMHDILGIRIVCDCTPEMLYQYSDLVRESLGSWLKKEYDQRKMEVPTKRPQGAIYIDLKKEDTIDGFSYEVQIMTKQFYEQRERERAHWSYKLAENTGQKFDQTEMYAPKGEFEADFNRVFYELKDWVFVFVQTQGKGGTKVLRSKRLPKDSIVADIAALSNINMLNNSFSGAATYDWQKGVFYERNSPNSRSALAIDYILQPGDILIIENTGRLEGAQLLRLRQKAKTLRAQMMLSLIEFGKDAPSLINKVVPLSGETSLKNKFAEAGITFDYNLNLKKFLDALANSLGLRDREELYAALTYCSWRISVSKVIEEAKIKGESILKKKFIEEETSLDDFALGQIARSFGIDLKEIFYIRLGTGQITEHDLYAKMHKIRRKPEGVLSVHLSKLFQFEVTVPREGMSSQKIRKLADRIEGILDENGFKDPQERIRLPKLKGKEGDIRISFTARAGSQAKAGYLQKTLMQSLRIKGKKVDFEEFYNPRKTAAQWEMVLKFLNQGQDISELTRYLIDEINGWSPLSSMIKFDVQEDVTKKGINIIEVRAIIATDINHSRIAAKITKFKNNQSIISASPRAISQQNNSLDMLYKSRLNAINCSI